jgi:cellulose synthase/poly-beta-1,6-N-acetylglucosamine synthase-like glycosyltransferase
VKFFPLFHTNINHLHFSSGNESQKNVIEKIKDKSMRKWFMMITVSVIIPTFNRAYLISRVIQSALFQIYRDFELIIGQKKLLKRL